MAQDSAIDGAVIISSDERRGMVHGTKGDVCVSVVVGLDATPNKLLATKSALKALLENCQYVFVQPTTPDRLPPKP